MRCTTTNEVPISILSRSIERSERKMVGMNIDPLEILPLLLISSKVAFNPGIGYPDRFRDHITSNTRLLPLVLDWEGVWDSTFKRPTPGKPSGEATDVTRR